MYYPSAAKRGETQNGNVPQDFHDRAPAADHLRAWRHRHYETAELAASRGSARALTDLPGLINQFALSEATVKSSREKYFSSAFQKM